MQRRALFLIPGLLAGYGEQSKVRGKLLPGRKLAVAGSVVQLEGDGEVAKVLDDERLLGSDFEAEGERLEDGKFRIDGIHNKPLYVYQKQERLGVSYWCEICYIRTYAPGECWCCQEDTKLDPKDPNTPDRKP